jgi:neutral ceramidase
MLRPLSLLALLLATVAVLVSAVGDKYLIGVGKGDITGPVVEIPFHGYAMLDQKGTGVKQRLYSRSFIIADVAKPSDRILYIIADIQGGDTGIRNSVLDGLKAMGADYLQYTKGSLAFVGTHSYSGPGGWHNYLLHQFPSAGFDKQRFDAIVAGTLLSIKRAHESMVEVSANSQLSNNVNV